MNASITPESLLEQIAQIYPLERGKLCILRKGPNGPYYNHQTWDAGKNVSRYVPRDQVSALQKGIAGYERFETLVEQYVRLMEQKSRTDRAAGIKKKSQPGTFFSHKTRKSDN